MQMWHLLNFNILGFRPHKFQKYRFEHSLTNFEIQYTFYTSENMKRYDRILILEISFRSRFSYLTEQSKDDLATVFLNISPVMESPSPNCENWFWITEDFKCPIITKMSPNVKVITQDILRFLWYLTNVIWTTNQYKVKDFLCPWHWFLIDSNWVFTISNLAESVRSGRSNMSFTSLFCS